jgi:hypothetical protein
MISPAYSYMVQGLDVEIDPETGHIKIHESVTAHDCGQPINTLGLIYLAEIAAQIIYRHKNWTSAFSGVNTRRTCLKSKIAIHSVDKERITSNIILADEINRTTPKTQSSLLEAMNELQVSIDGVTYRLNTPFMVLATQNPLEYHGTYRSRNPSLIDSR